MAARIVSWLSWPALLRTLVAHARLAVRLVREPSVPLLLKAMPLLAALYVISPVDVIPDLLPVLGQMDDLGLVLIVLELFLRWCPADAVTFHRSAIAAHTKYAPMITRGQVIDAEWRKE